MSVPNQRIITIQKAKADKEHIYTTFNLEALNIACKSLKTIGGIKLYLYLGKNQHNYTFELSRADFMEWSGLAETAYKSGIKDLIENGFLVNTVGNRYVFFESGKENKYMSKGSKEQKGADGKRIKEQQNDVDYFSF